MGSRGETKSGTFWLAASETLCQPYGLRSPQGETSNGENLWNLSAARFFSYFISGTISPQLQNYKKIIIILYCTIYEASTLFYELTRACLLDFQVDLSFVRMKW